MENNGCFLIRVSAHLENREAERCFKVLEDWAAARPDRTLVRTGPMGYGDLEPLVIVGKPGAPAVWYHNMTIEKAGALAVGWLDGDDPMAELALGVDGDKAFRGIPPLSALPLFKLQKRLALRRCGFVDPARIDGIAGSGGYRGLLSALRMSPEEVLGILGAAGLRERDGAGGAVFPAWSAFRASGSHKVLVCRAIDHDIDAHLARLLLESNPHGVLEGLLVAAYAVGAPKAILAVPANMGSIRPLLDTALAGMRAYLDTCGAALEAGFNCAAEVREVPAALVMNDKTALLRCLEGYQAIPTPNAPEGDTLGGAAVLVTGIETLAAIPPLLQTEKGFSAHAGTKVLTLAGAVEHPYTIEVPLGAPLSELVRDIGGAADVKAVQLGGPASVWSGPGFLEKTICDETAGEAGAALGLSLLNVASGTMDAVETAERQMCFLRGQSCGKCVFCREGTLHLHQLLEEILGGSGGDDSLSLMTTLGLKMRSNCLCALGRTAANPVLSSLELFRPEFEGALKNVNSRGGSRHAAD